MIYLAMALHCEAQPFIERYGLKRDQTRKHFEIYNGEEMSLVITGVGKMRSAIGVTYLLSQGSAGAGDAVINVGVCGSRRKEYKIGTPVLIHQIIDNETGTQFFPDILFYHTFREGSIQTHHKVIKEGSSQPIKADFVDMEAAGFFQAAQHFLAPHQIYVIKAISDYLEDISFDKNFIRECIGMGMESLDFLIHQIRELCKEEKLFTLEEISRLESLKQHLHLTATQAHQLEDLTRKYKIRRARELPLFRDIMGRRVGDRDERKQAFDAVQAILSDEQL